MVFLQPPDNLFILLFSANVVVSFLVFRVLSLNHEKNVDVAFHNFTNAYRPCAAKIYA
jgi:hypothetical protein